MKEQDWNKIKSATDKPKENKSYDKTLTRLILILTKLSNNDRPKIKELAEEFGVGVRTIQRDIYERLIYFPIEKDSFGQLNFIDGFSLDRSTLENDEMLLIYLAMSQIKTLSKTFESKINNVFSKLLNPSFSSPYFIKGKSYESIDNFELFSPCKKRRFRRVPMMKKNEVREVGYSLDELGIVFTKANADRSWKQKLSDGAITHLFLVSTYYYMSKGQNLNYDFIIEGQKKRVSKDFDGIYCGEITNLMQTELKSDSKSKEALMLTLLYQTTILQNNGEITLKDKNNYLKTIMKNRKSKNMYSYTNDYNYACMIYIIQSIGRLHRTSYGGTMYMYFHWKNVQILSNFDDSGQIVLPSVKFAIKKAREVNLELRNVPECISIERKNANIRNNISYFKAIINNPSASRKEIESTIKEWKDTRSFLLSNPTIEKANNSEHKYFYCPNERYWYKEDGDYENITIAHFRQDDFHEVSISNSRLDKLFKIPELNDCFLENNINTKFNHPYKMVPIVYNNIYKGAIGEVLGEYIFKNFAKINLQEITFDSCVPFEFFDFTNKDESLFVDFKYFSNYTASCIQTKEAIINKVKSKLVSSNNTSKLVFIVGLFVDEQGVSNYLETIHKEGNIYLIPHLIKEKDGQSYVDHKMVFKIKEIYDKYVN